MQCIPQMWHLKLYTGHLKLVAGCQLCMADSCTPYRHSDLLCDSPIHAMGCSQVT